MAWCPNCKNEYRDGIDMCPDCNIKLVDELPPESEDEGPKPVVLMKTGGNIGKKVIKYLSYSGINSAALAGLTSLDAEEPIAGDDEELSDISADDTGDIDEAAVTSVYDYAIIVSDTELDAALELLPGIAPGEDVDEDRLYELVPDIEDQLEEVENEQASMEFSELRNEASTVYVKKKDKYADLRFSGFSFIGFGIIGVVIIILNIFNVIRLFNTYSLAVMSVVFIIFFIIGISSLRRAASVKDSVAVEDEFTRELNDWIKDHLSDEIIDEWYDENREDQENYFEIQAKMAALIREQFPNINPSYVEELSEERYTSYLEHSAYEDPDEMPTADDDMAFDENTGDSAKL